MLTHDNYTAINSLITTRWWMMTNHFTSVKYEMTYSGIINIWYCTKKRSYSWKTRQNIWGSDWCDSKYKLLTSALRLLEVFFKLARRFSALWRFVQHRQMGRHCGTLSSCRIQKLCECSKYTLYTFTGLAK